jgi:hypothetical protein
VDPGASLISPAAPRVLPSHSASSAGGRTWSARQVRLFTTDVCVSLRMLKAVLPSRVAGRPCERCVRRGISHLCTAESDSQPLNGSSAGGNAAAASSSGGGGVGQKTREDSSLGGGSDEGGGDESGSDRPPAVVAAAASAAAPPPSQAGPQADVPSVSASNQAFDRPRAEQAASSSSGPTMTAVPAPAAGLAYDSTPVQQPAFTQVPPPPPSTLSSPPRPAALVQPHHLLSLAATPNATTPIHSPSWPALPPSFGLETFGRDHPPSAEWASLSSFIDSLDFPPDLFTPDVRSPAAGGVDDAGVGDREAYAAFIEQLRLKQTQLAASRPGSPRTQAFTQASSSFLQLPMPQLPSSPATAAAASLALTAGVVPSKREFLELLQAQFEGAQLAPKGKLWDWERGWKAVDDWLATRVPFPPSSPCWLPGGR